MIHTTPLDVTFGYEQDPPHHSLRFNSASCRNSVFGNKLSYVQVRVLQEAAQKSSDSSDEGGQIWTTVCMKP